MSSTSRSSFWQRYTSSWQQVVGLCLERGWASSDGYTFAKHGLKACLPVRLCTTFFVSCHFCLYTCLSVSARTSPFFRVTKDTLLVSLTKSCWRGTKIQNILLYDTTRTSSTTMVPLVLEDTHAEEQSICSSLLKLCCKPRTSGGESTWKGPNDIFDENKVHFVESILYGSTPH